VVFTATEVVFPLAQLNPHRTKTGEGYDAPVESNQRIQTPRVAPVTLSLLRVILGQSDW
jgi:hypothetical protein